jgi:hypothetical protein
MPAIEGLEKAIAYQAAVVSHFARLGNQLDPPIAGAAIEALYVRFLMPGIMHDLPFAPLDFLG